MGAHALGGNALAAPELALCALQCCGSIAPPLLVGVRWLWGSVPLVAAAGGLFGIVLELYALLLVLWEA